MNWGFKNLPVQCESIDGLNIDLLRPLIYQDKDGNVYRAVRTTQSDGASTPNVIHSLGFEPYGSYWPGALMHDAGYKDSIERQTSGDWLNGAYEHHTLTKDECDNLLLDCMAWLGVDEFKKNAIYQAVHVAGFTAFSNDRKTA